jgi:Domain of unknown function (DUF4184)
LPFTLSHPSAALPLWPLVRRGIVPLAPFAVGAVVPDLEYLWRLEPFAQLSHSARGLALFCLPVGVVVLLAWDWLLAPCARALVGLRGAGTGTPRTLGGGVRALVALALGSLSHVSWDAFTHRDTIGPTLVPSLRQTAITLAGYDIPWYNVLQVASSLVGGAVVLRWLWRLVEREGEGHRALYTVPRVRGWLVIGAAALAMAAWNAPRRGEMTSPSRVKIVAGRAAVGGMAGASLALLALSLLQRVGRWSFDDRRGNVHA